jgi:diguanylate cyclase (GGDEF)-like protein
MEQDAELLLRATLNSYHAALNTVGEAAARACPPAGEGLQAALLKLSAALSKPVSQSEVADITQSVQDELKSWAENASKLFEQRASDVQEVLLMAGTAAQQVGERDKRYSRRFTEFGDRLQATSRLGDVVVIRHALGQHSADLKSYVAQMVKDSEETIGQLRSQLANYEFRLEEMEHLATQDALTGLSNRRKVERQIEVRIRSGQTFSVISLDLNGFKQLNDTYGHLAGDDLLQQFAVELRTVFRSYDIVGRIGGDEFIALLDADISVANAKLDRIRNWVNGNYAVKGNPSASKVKVTAAAGAAQWSPGETMLELLKRADEAMYADKKSSAMARRAS